MTFDRVLRRGDILSNHLKFTGTEKSILKSEVSLYHMILISGFDYRANSFLFINIELTTLLIYHYSAYSKPLPYVILVTGYNSQGYSKIIYYVRLTLQINNRHFVYMPFYIIPLRTYNVIIGCKQFAYFRINLIVTDYKLLQL